MNTNIQIKIDEWLIKPIISILNILVKGLGKILRIDHSLKNKEFKTIAVCKYKGMGSIIQATPLLKSLRKKYPNAKIIFITTSGNISILKKIDYIDDVITINDSSFLKLITSSISFIIKLLKQRIEVYIDLEVYSNFSSLITILSLSKNRLGFYLQSKHYRLGNYTHMMYHNTQSPIMETYLQFARLLDCETISPELTMLKSDIKSITIDSNRISLETTDYIVINPNASDLRLERRWGKSRYNSLINNILKKYADIKIMIIGGNKEQDYVKKVLKNIDNERLINIAGKTNLDELIAVIKNAKFIITNDSGPMHIAFACKTPTISLFGPCSPSQYGKHNSNIAIYANAYCSPCIHDFVNPPCNGNNICMKLISVDSVMDTVTGIMEKSDFIGNINKDIIYKFNDFTIGTLSRKHK
jgi:lipopolysaccharide heptosyltransferase II